MDEDVRGGFVHPEAPTGHGIRPDRFKRGVGDHFGGQADGAGMESRIEFAYEGFVSAVLGIGLPHAGGRTGISSLHIGVRIGLRIAFRHDLRSALALGVGDRAHVRVEGNGHELIEPASRVLERCDLLRIVDRMCLLVADQGGRCPQGRGHGLRHRERGPGSVVQCSSPIMAVFPATHSTRPTSLDSATADEAALVGG